MGRKGRNNDVYGVIGVGRFGLAVAQTLLELGKDVIALDINAQRLRPLESTAADVMVIEEISMILRALNRFARIGTTTAPIAMGCIATIR